MPPPDRTSSGLKPADALLAALYDELRRLAAARMERERVGHTLTATALVHEAWLRIADDRPQGWHRAQFFAAAAQAMRRILVERARGKGRLRRGGHKARQPWTGIDLAVEQDPTQVLALNEAVEQLATADPRAAQVVQLRIYAGLSEAEIAEILGVSERVVRRDWQYARAWLADVLGGPG